MKSKIIVFLVILYIASICLCLSNKTISTAFAQSDSCTDGQSLVIDTVNKRYKCITISSSGLGSGGNVNMTIANASSTGTTVNRLAKLTGAPSTALITSTSDTENAVGIVTSGAGTTGSAVIAILGQVNCDFDNATVAGDYFIISTITAGKCHDNGATFPTSAAAYGRVLTTNGSSGTYSVELMTPDIAFQNAGNGKSKPGGSNLDYQYNGTGSTFAGGRLKQENTNIVSVNGGLNTSQIFKVYNTDNGSGITQDLKFSVNGSSQFEILSEAVSASTLELALGITGSSNRLLIGSSSFRPNANRGYDLGASGAEFNQAWFFQGVVDASGDITFNSGGKIKFAADGRLQIRDSNGNGASGTIAFENRTPSQITANQNNYSVPVPAYFNRFTTDAARNITGLTFGTPADGEIHTIFNSGSSDFVLTNQDANSSSINRFLVTGGNSITISPDSGAAMIYDNTTQRWRVWPLNNFYSAGTPSIAGNGTLDTGSKDSAGKVSVNNTGASTVTLTFSITFARAPACTVTNETTANLSRATSTTTTVVLSGTTITGDKFAYSCITY